MSQRVARVAIVGAGPAGAYAAGQLLADGKGAIAVDVFDRLATPWGLVRSGVAPDHPKIKSVTRVFEKIATTPGFRLLGNVEVGRDLSHAELSRCYDAVIYAVGAMADRRLGIGGEDLSGCYAASDFVAWYNGHPDHCDDAFDLSARRAVVIGNGNVALDVARMLALTADELAGTDIADHALSALAASHVEEIVVLGRRGPLQAAFTNPEIRELANLADAQVIVDPLDLELDAISRTTLESGAADATSIKNLELLTEYANTSGSAKRKRIVLRFYASPTEILGADGKVVGVRIVRNELLANERGGITARPTDSAEVIEAGLVLRSIGYRATPIEGVPFDERGATVCNDLGRVIDPLTGEASAGVYATGWVKRGPSGVIGTNKRCAQETVALLLEDLAAGVLPPPTSESDEPLATIYKRGVQVVDHRGWLRIDERERRLGESQKRPRVKLVRTAELLECARSSEESAQPTDI